MSFKIGAALFSVVASVFSMAPAKASSTVIFNSLDRNREYIITGVALKETNAPFMNGSRGFQVTLNLLVGGNSCFAAQRQFDLSHQTEDQLAQTLVNVSYLDANSSPCVDIYKPVFKEVTVYVPTMAGYGITVDTNTEELRNVVLLNSERNTLVNALSIERVDPIQGDEKWVAAHFKANVLAGTNACEASNSRLHGYTYTYEGALRVAVAAEKINPNLACPRNYDPVYADLNFLGTVKRGSANRVEVENATERGAIQVIALPDALR